MKQRRKPMGATTAGGRARHDAQYNAGEPEGGIISTTPSTWVTPDPGGSMMQPFPNHIRPYAKMRDGTDGGIGVNKRRSPLTTLDCCA